MLAVDATFHGVFGRVPDPLLVGGSFPRLFRADAHDMLIRELTEVFAGDRSQFTGKFAGLGPSGEVVPVEVKARKLARPSTGPALSVLVRPAT
ncbi:hypothetical protein [Amycolatopsis sp. NPDC059657]|uniref:hypothetical protein n=1 Tax=Amycolatopsis sp. NPDC059657 TaxID=3346899 RepID=UPI00366D7D45